MEKFYGEIGYGFSEKTAPGVSKKRIVTRNYKGDIVRNHRKLDDSGYLNDNIVVSNEISIVADAYAYENFMNILYVKWMNTKWKVIAVDVSRPRLRLTLGEIYNGQEN